MNRNRTFRSLLKDALVFAASRKAAQALARWINREKVIFLAYHGVVRDKEPLDAWTVVRESEFRMQMEYIKANFDCLSIDEALFNKRRGVTRPGVVVTFDDGYANNLEIAFPILAEFGIPAIIYVTTRFVLERDLFWPDKIWMAAGLSQAKLVDLRGADHGLKLYPLSRKREEWQTNVSRIIEDLKKINACEIDNVVKKVVDRFKSSPGANKFRIEVEGNAFTPLTADQVLELSRNPLVTIGAHTHCHSLLDKVPLSQAKETMCHSKVILERIVGSRIDHFAYPNGNFNNDIATIAKNLGFKTALTFKHGFFNYDDDLFTIRRIGVGANTSIGLLKAMMSRIFELKWKLCR
jgi:peptidoglycan/xylan/chitin deacetylase (PgdA/CDA1 family)